MNLSRVLIASFVGTSVFVGACAERADRTDEHREGDGHDHESRRTTSQALSSANLEDENASSLPNKVLSLTFDDGPGIYTSELSTYLKDQGIRATFFINGKKVALPTAPLPVVDERTANAAAILAQIAADGHLLANHTTTHRDIATEVTNNTQRIAELNQTDAHIAAYIPASHFLFRAPYGSWNAAAYNALHADPATDKYVGPIYWQAGGYSNGYPNRAADWACWDGSMGGAGGQLTSAQCGAAYITEIDTFGKGVVLMHDPYGWANGSTLGMVQYMVPILKGKGYSFVRLDEVPAIAALLPPLCHATCTTCTGQAANQCTGCPTGKYLSANPGTCVACGAACQTNQYESTACGGTSNRVCSACSTTCATCTGPAASDCASCTGNRYLNGTECTTCTACAPGTYAAGACSPTANTVCEPCDPSCQACSGPNAADCGSCPTGYYLGGGICNVCKVCEGGEQRSAACGASTNTTCAPCAPGTFSTPTHAHSGAACTACPAGTFAAKSGATECKACPASCDDGDACTTDSCDAAKGCAHTPIPGCGPYPADAGSNDAAAETDAGTPVSESEDGCSVARAPRTNVSTFGLFGLGALAIASIARRHRRSRSES